MKVQKMGGDYLAVVNDQGTTLAVVDCRDKVNPTISVSSTISLWDLRGVMYHIEEYLKHPW